MVRKRLQNWISEGRYTLPIVAVYAMVVCMLTGVFKQGQWLQFAALALSAYLMLQLNNSNALIRIYSRMVSCSFLVLITMTSFLMSSVEGALVQLCMIVFYMMFFHAYQDNSASGRLFYAFVAWGTASLSFVQILYFVPVLLVLLVTNIMAFSMRNLRAMLLGLMAPYWFMVGYEAFVGNFHYLQNHFAQLFVFAPLFDYSDLDPHRTLTFCFVAFLALTGSIHFMRHSYQDKIRTRMFYEVFITMNACTIVFLLLQPQHYDYLIRLMIINTSVLIAHFFALTNTRITNISFIFITLSAFLMTGYNLWIS